MPRRPRRPPRRARIVAALVLVAAPVLVVGACASGGGSDVDVSGDPELAQGRDVYNENCARCHGPDGGGGVGNKLNEGVVAQVYPDIEDQIDVITNGLGAMPAWEGTLSPEEIRAVARYEREAL